MTMSPGCRAWEEDLLDVGSEALAVDRAVEDPWRIDPVVAQGGQEGRGLPVAVRDLGGEPLPRGAQPRSGAMLVLVQVSSMKTRRSGSIAALILCPLRPPARDVGTIAFAGDHGFF